MLHFDSYHTVQSTLTKPTNHVIVIISFYTLGWIQNLITTLWKLLPDSQLLIIDNNPNPGEENLFKIRNYYQRHERDSMIAAERYWLSLQPELIVLQQPDRNNLTHGNGLDFAMRWCLQNKINVMTHIEPDCFFDNAKWLEEQMDAIKQGNFLAGCFRYIWGSVNCHEYLQTLSPEGQRAELEKMPIHVACTTYYLPFCKNFSFRLQFRKEDINHPQYASIVSGHYDLCNNALMGRKQEVTGKCLWDTGHKIWYEVAKHNKAVLTRRHGITHTFNSMETDFWTRKKLLSSKKVLRGSN